MVHAPVQTLTTPTHILGILVLQTSNREHFEYHSELILISPGTDISAMAAGPASFDPESFVWIASAQTGFNEPWTSAPNPNALLWKVFLNDQIFNTAHLISWCASGISSSSKTISQSNSEQNILSAMLVSLTHGTVWYAMNTSWRRAGVA
jgi:hypothetical protein